MFFCLSIKSCMQKLMHGSRWKFYQSWVLNQPTRWFESHCHTMWNVLLYVLLKLCVCYRWGGLHTYLLILILSYVLTQISGKCKKPNTYRRDRGYRQYPVKRKNKPQSFLFSLLRTSHLRFTAHRAADNNVLLEKFKHESLQLRTETEVLTPRSWNMTWTQKLCLQTLNGARCALKVTYDDRIPLIPSQPCINQKRGNSKPLCVWFQLLMFHPHCADRGYWVSDNW